MNIILEQPLRLGLIILMIFVFIWLGDTIFSSITGRKI